LTDASVAVKWLHDHIILVSTRVPAPPAVMIGFLARFIGLWMIAGALVALVIDGTKTIAAAALTVTPLGQSWFSISQSTLIASQTFIQEKVEAYIGHWLWDPLIMWILLLPTWLVLGLIGAWLVYVGRKRRLRAAYAS
jgi:hypothetical protein